MFRETIIHKWDIVTTLSHLLYTIPHTLNIRYLFYRTSHNHKQHHQLCCTTECERVPGLSPSWKILFYTSILLYSSVIDLLNKFVDWKCFGGGWFLMGTFRSNYFIRSRQVHSNNRWYKFHGSIRKFFGCMDHNLAWLYFSENYVFDGSAYAMPWCLSL